MEGLRVFSMKRRPSHRDISRPALPCRSRLRFNCWVTPAAWQSDLGIHNWAEMPSRLNKDILLIVKQRKAEWHLSGEGEGIIRRIGGWGVETRAIMLIQGRHLRGNDNRNLEWQSNITHSPPAGGGALPFSDEDMKSRKKLWIEKFPFEGKLMAAPRAAEDSTSPPPAILTDCN